MGSRCRGQVMHPQAGKVSTGRTRMGVRSCRATQAIGRFLGGKNLIRLRNLGACPTYGVGQGLGCGRPQNKPLFCDRQEMTGARAAWPFSHGSPRPEQTSRKLTMSPLLSSASLPKHLTMHLAQPTLESAGVQQAERRGSEGTLLPGLGKAGTRCC